MNIIPDKESGRRCMQRALYLSAIGGPRVSPNPFVGAVIMAEGRIIGEGYHREYGKAHAEVNAIASVNEADRPLLRKSIMYVTLEPCSHFGKTPPCADLIINSEIPHVVVAAEDPFLNDYDSGIEKMRKAGIKVEVGLMKNEALWINRRFFTAHTLKRPFILLKWAQSADGFISAKDGRPLKISTDFTQLLMHKERAYYDAIMVGTDTVLIDNPSLTCRLWPCRNPQERPVKLTFDSPRLKSGFKIQEGELILKSSTESLDEFINRLYREHHIISVMVEGGAKTLESFASKRLFEEVRIESSSVIAEEGIKAPSLERFFFENGMRKLPPKLYGENSITYFVKNY